MTYSYKGDPSPYSVESTPYVIRSCTDGLEHFSPRSKIVHIQPRLFRPTISSIPPTFRLSSKIGIRRNQDNKVLY